MISMRVSKNLQTMTTQTFKSDDIVKSLKNNKLYIVYQMDRWGKEAVEVCLYKNGKSWGTHYTRPVSEFELVK